MTHITWLKKSIMFPLMSVPPVLNFSGALQQQREGGTNRPRKRQHKHIRSGKLINKYNPNRTLIKLCKSLFIRLVQA